MPATAKTAQCAHCSKPFKHRRNKRFCSDRCRYNSWKSGAEIDLKPCFYCGMPAGTIDHVPPRSVRPIILEFKSEARWPFTTVDCCYECNSILGDRQPWTLAERKKKVKERLRRKYSRYLKIPDWSEQELKSQGQNLRSFIDESIILKEMIKRRLAW